MFEVAEAKGSLL